MVEDKSRPTVSAKHDPLVSELPNEKSELYKLAFPEAWEARGLDPIDGRRLAYLEGFVNGLHVDEEDRFKVLRQVLEQMVPLKEKQAHG